MNKAREKASVEMSDSGGAAGIRQDGFKEAYSARLLGVFASSLKLGLTSFGGPVAHLGYFRHEYVERRRWVDERSYAELVAMCQFLPGPASSQVGIGIGTIRAGWLGGVVAWLGFTAPSALLLMLFGFYIQYATPGSMGWIHGLKLVAVAIVAHAVLGMGQKLITGPALAAVALLAAAVSLLWPSVYSQVSVLAAAGIFGCFRRAERTQEGKPMFAESPMGIGKLAGACCLLLFGLLLVLLPLLSRASGHPLLQMTDGVYRAGSLVFGGGHVVLPLLEREFLSAGWVSRGDFLAGYGAAQAVPGPLFTFVSYLGMAGFGVGGALLATAAIFLPAFLLVFGVLPFWNVVRKQPRLQGSVAAVNAAVVGILAAAFYNPIWISAVNGAADLAAAAVLFALLQFAKAPPWIIVLLGLLYGLGSSLVG
ncbi:chromate efflux transporter [Paenibacillus filicis]|uniref:Chromate efflux transporter n=1 Tax=Paenibacillus filicis TaxID=669464 RepID=A0ABU9DV86_9BACL